MEAAATWREISTAEPHHTCFTPRGAKLLHKKSRLHDERLKQHDWGRRKQVHTFYPQGSTAVTWPGGQNSFIWIDKYPCNYSSSPTSNGWLIQSHCPSSAFQGSPLFMRDRLWKAVKGWEATASQNYIGMVLGVIELRLRRTTLVS